jgi:mycofactocin system transcriptional regulator
VTSRAHIESVALDLFALHGFEATTADDIAAAAGVSRRTFFRYFPSKNDLVWGDFDTLLAGLAAFFDAQPRDEPLRDVLIAGILRFNAVPPEAIADHRHRMGLILHVPALQAYSTLRYAAWRDVVAACAAERLGVPFGSLDAQLVGHVMLAAAVTAYEQWLADPGADLQELLAAVLGKVGIDGVI